MTWRQAASALAFGQRRKIPHCGQSASAYVSNSPQGLRLHCFRCDANEFHPHDGASLRYLLERARMAEEAELARPYPEVVPLQEGPPEGRLWGLRAGLGPETLNEYGFGWSVRMKRVVYPVLVQGTPDGRWGARAVLQGQHPKYLASKGTGGPYSLGEGTHIVITEDVLSCIKVHRAGFFAAAALGTSLKPESIVADFPQVREASIWTDPDKAGRAAAGRLRKALQAFGVKSRTIQSDKDPKYYTRAQIKEHLHE